MSKDKNYQTHRTNPFMDSEFVTDNKTVRISATGDDLDINKFSKNVTQYTKVKKKEMFEIFCKTIKKKLKITSGGIRTFKYLYDQVEGTQGLNLDNLSLSVDKEDCMRKAGYTSIQSVFNGINELIDKNIIAKSGTMNIYFINPNFFRPADYLVVTEYFKLK